MMDIAEVARQSGFPASTLRYYEDRGLIVSVGRRGLRRMFEPAVLRRLALIALGRDVGFSLIEIAAFMAVRYPLIGKSSPQKPTSWTRG